MSFRLIAVSAFSDSKMNFENQPFPFMTPLHSSSPHPQIVSSPLTTTFALLSTTRVPSTLSFEAASGPPALVSSSITSVPPASTFRVLFLSTVRLLTETGFPDSSSSVTTRSISDPFGMIKSYPDSIYASSRIPGAEEGFIRVYSSAPLLRNSAAEPPSVSPKEPVKSSLHPSLSIMKSPDPATLTSAAPERSSSAILFTPAETMVRSVSTDTFSIPALTIIRALSVSVAPLFSASKLQFVPLISSVLSSRVSSPDTVIESVLTALTSIIESGEVITAMSAALSLGISVLTFA